MKAKINKYLFYIIIIISILGIFFSPTKQLVEQLKQNLPYVALGILISEILLTIGFFLMLYIATPEFVKGVLKDFNKTTSLIFHIKDKIKNFNWKQVAKKCNDSTLFWFGFWVSVIGACGDGFVIIWGIGRSLPITSWGLMLLPFWDLSLTFIIRRAIYIGVKS